MARGQRGELWQEPHGAENCGDYERSKEGDEYDIWVQIVSEVARYPVRDCSIPGVPNRSRVRNRPGIVSSGYRFPGLGV
jgi:hypothetical protein